MPAIEKDVRASISKKTGSELIFSDRFELRLLLTQSEATRYAAALAKQIADRDKDDLRRKSMEKLAEQMGQLRDRVLDRLAVVPAESPAP